MYTGTVCQEYFFITYTYYNRKPHSYHLGYEKARVTPYMHGMVYHVPGFMERHQGIKKFTGQGIYIYIN